MRFTWSRDSIPSARSRAWLHVSTVPPTVVRKMPMGEFSKSWRYSISERRIFSSISWMFLSCFFITLPWMKFRLKPAYTTRDISHAITVIMIVEIVPVQLLGWTKLIPARNRTSERAYDGAFEVACW